jgi:hypothetical protein
MAIRYMVVQTFEATRTPCPEVGTCGRFIRKDGPHYVIQFDESFVDSEGSRWHPGNDGIRVKFFPHEVRPVIEKVN